MWMSIRQLSKLSGISEKRIRSYIMSCMRYYQEVEGWILRMKNYYNENDKKTAAWLRELIKAGLIADGEVDDRSIEEVTAKDVVGYVQCHWFAGIGGWSYALRLAGWTDDRPVWTGSCPCQPFSVAGKRQGEKDSRHLWPVFARLIRECKPVTVFGEQVASKDGRRWLSGVFADLEAMGYRRAGADLPAAGVGAPHIRQRLFWVADSETTTRRAMREKEYRRGNAEVGGSSGAGRLADMQGKRCEKDGEYCQRYTKRASICGVDGRMGDMHNEVSQGRSDDNGEYSCQLPPWSASYWIECSDGKARRIPLEPEFFPLADGIPERVVRLRGYGNAIIPQTAAMFIRAFMDSDSQENLHQNDIRDFTR